LLRKNKKLEIETSNNNNLLSRNKKHGLSFINNKSSNCITPGSFNPWINYKIDDKKYKNTKIRNDKNKDHFFHMNPTEIYQYKPILKRVFNLSTFSGNQKVKKSGKKIFGLKNAESTEENNNRNKLKYRQRYIINNTNNFFNKNNKIYEYDAPVISYRNVKKIF